MSNINISDDNVEITELTITNSDVILYLKEIPETEREVKLLQAIEVGVFCLERAATAKDVEGMKRQVDRLIQELKVKVESIPVDLAEKLKDKIGTDEGQVLAPVNALITEVEVITKERLKSVQDLLAQEIDPSKDDSTLGKALQSIRNLLNPERVDSIQSHLAKVLSDISASDGALAEAVKKVVADGLTPLKNEVDKLAQEFREEKAVKEALMQTTRKGVDFEEVVTESLQGWRKVTGAEVEHTGSDSKPGDIKITFKEDSTLGTDFAIIIEAKDRQDHAGRKVISSELTRSMAERNCQAGIYVSKTLDGLAKEIVTLQPFDSTTPGRSGCFPVSR